MRLDPKQKRLMVIGGGGALLALMFLFSRGGSQAAPAPASDPASAATFAPPVDNSGGADLTEALGGISQIGAGQQQLADLIVGGQQQLSDQIGGLQLGAAAAPVPSPPATGTSPIPASGAHNNPASHPAARAPSQIHLRVADARQAAPSKVKSTSNKVLAQRARQNPGWGPHTIAAGHRLPGHSVRF